MGCAVRRRYRQGVRNLLPAWVRLALGLLDAEGHDMIFANCIMKLLSRSKAAPLF